jgi:hypothetical protein
MTAPVGLPPGLHGQLTALARRIRRLRMVRGMAALVLVVALLFGGALLADTWLDLGDAVMAAVAAVLTAAAGLVILLKLIVPLSRPPRAAALAALVEKCYPELGELLTSAVELSNNEVAAHGAPALIARLVQEADNRSRPLAFTQAFPARPTALMAGAAGAALLLVLLPALVWAERYADFTGRLLFAWQAGGRYSFIVDPGDHVVAVGGSMTIDVRLERRSGRLAWPEGCYLVMTDEAGAASRLPMRGQAPARFTWTLAPVARSFAYRIEAGHAASESFQVKAVEPLDLAAGLTCTVTPPPYVNPAVHPEQTLQGSAAWSALQYSRIRVGFHFTRPAQAARLEVATRPAAGPRRTSVLAVPLAGDRKTATLELPALPAGEYDLKLHTEAEHQIARSHALPALSIWPDGPPTFIVRPRLPVAGQLQAAPGDSLGLHVGLTDTVGLDRLEVEYRVNRGPSHVTTLLEAKGATSIAGTFPFKLPAAARAGDTVQFRLVGWDNRRLPAGGYRDAEGRAVPPGNLGPQVVYHPDRADGQDRWLTLKINPAAEPLPKQEVVAEHTEVDRWLEAIRQRLEGERGQLAQLRQATQSQPALDTARANTLRQIQKENTGVLADLLALAEQAAKLPPLRGLADSARDIAGRELAQTDEALQKARSHHAEAAARQQHLQKAAAEVDKALRRLDDLRRLNERLAADRLDQLRLAELAQRQAELAKTPAGGPRDSPALKKQQAGQDRLLADLQRLADESKLLREAQAAMLPETAHQLAEQAHGLAGEQRQLARAQEQARREQLGGLLQAFARKQEQLAGQADRLPSHANVQPGTDALQAAAQALKQGQAAEGLRLQERAAQELERRAGEMEQAGWRAADVRAAAQRLKDAEQRLGERLNGEAARLAVKSAREILKDLDNLARDQEAVGRAAAKLPGAGKEAARLAAAAAQALRQRDPFRAYEAMQQARDALDRLTRQPPMPASATDPASQKEAEALKAAAQEARRLARAQKDLRADLQKALAGAGSGKGSPGNEPLAKLAGQQKALLQKAGELKKGLDRLAQLAQGTAPAREAAAAAKQAHHAMKQAQAAAQQGQLDQARQAQDQAATLLDQAGRKAADAGTRTTGAAAHAAARKTGEALMHGQQRAAEAQAQLGKGQAKAAQAAMQQAALALSQAARQAQQQLTDPGQQPASRSPSPTGAAHSGTVEGKEPGKERRLYAGRPWGELPGELRTRVLQDLRARYGDDYAGIIQHYFESIADTGS